MTRKQKCKYCELHPCKRTSCDRRLMIIDGEMSMQPRNKADYFDYILKRKMYRETRITSTNGGMFRRTIIDK